MPFPASWPPRPAGSARSIRFFVTDTATAAFADKGYMFAEDAGAVTYTPLPVVQPGSNAPVVVPAVSGGGVSYGDPAVQIWANNIRISNDGPAVLEFTFDGTNVHGSLKSGEAVLYRNRCESGIAVRGATAVYRIEAW